ncbi:MAG: hypothetical protein AAFX85_03140 [Pseudomonadota bacterium]
MPHRLSFLSLVLGTFLLLVSPAHGARFAAGNVLATEGNQLFEYTIEGALVRVVDVPHPDTAAYEATDVVVAAGRAHVLNIAPFDPSYVSTYDTQTLTWTHAEIPAFLGNLSDGDLALLGDLATGVTVVATADGGGRWDCAEAGLPVSPGTPVFVRLSGRVE